VAYFRILSLKITWRNRGKKMKHFRIDNLQAEGGVWNHMNMKDEL
jgi:hypothetical protein